MCFEDSVSDGIVLNIHAIQQELVTCAMDPAQPPKLLPVTKTQGSEAILAVKKAGITAIGENRVQEIMNKFPALSADFEFHLIGRLQTNKIKYIMNRVHVIQSLDRWSLAQALDAHAGENGQCLPVLVEVNVGGESQKAGVPPDETEHFIRKCAKLPGIQVRGLMTVMPAVVDPETIRPLFRRMRELFEQLRMESIDGVKMNELSMGMSGDWRIAAQEGATMVRIGSAIFGERVSS